VLIGNGYGLGFNGSLRHLTAVIQNASQMLAGRGGGVAGGRPSVRARAPGARGDENRDRGSTFTAPPRYDPAAPSHVPRHSLKGMMAVLLGRRERWRRWDAEKSDLSMFAPTGWRSWPGSQL